MPAMDILLDKWQIAIGLLSAWTVGAVVGQVLHLMNRRLAYRIVDWLDSHRKGVIQVFYRLVHRPRGVLKATAFIFAVNLFGASLFQHSVLGTLILPPFILLFVGGFLVSLLVRKYPERLLIAVVVSPFEFAAFVVAATGGVSIGMSVLGIGNFGSASTALVEWATLFITLVVPLQLVGAMAEAALGRRLPDSAWPLWMFDDQT